MKKQTIKHISRRDFLKGTAAVGATVAISSLTGCAVPGEDEAGTTAAPSITAESSVPEPLSAAAALEESSAAESQGQETAPLDTEIYCIDRFVTKPGDGPEFLEDFLKEYLENAKRYGMELRSQRVSPPVWLDNESNTIELVWSIAGFNGWAAMVNTSRYEEGTIGWWHSIHKRVVSHDRSFFANTSDMEVINNV